jgi:hypothetical protein
MDKVIAFDLEIVKEIPDGSEWRSIRPLGISCASVLANDMALSDLFYHGQQTEPLSGEMGKGEIQRLITALRSWVMGGYKIITWNGLGFDFDVLAEESGMYEECKELALNHVDMMFQFFCIKGYPVGLDATAKGLGLGGKKGGMSGAFAPILWASPHLKDRLRVLRYVHEDAVATLEVFEKASDLGRIDWITKKGKLSSCWLNGWKTVKECLELPLPDTSWMDTSLSRENFYAWI